LSKKKGGVCRDRKIGSEALKREVEKRNLARKGWRKDRQGKAKCNK